MFLSEELNSDSLMFSQKKKEFFFLGTNLIREWLV